MLILTRLWLFSGLDPGTRWSQVSVLYTIRYAGLIVIFRIFKIFHRFNISYHLILGADYENNIHVKDKLIDAVKEKICKIEERKLLEQEERKKMEKMSKKEHEKYENEQKFQKTYGSKKRYKSVREEEREVHEAYQLILAEYHRRVMMRMKKKIKTVNMIRKLRETSMKENT